MAGSSHTRSGRQWQHATIWWACASTTHPHGQPSDTGTCIVLALRPICLSTASGLHHNEATVCLKLEELTLDCWLSSLAFAELLEVVEVRALGGAQVGMVKLRELRYFNPEDEDILARLRGHLHMVIVFQPCQPAWAVFPALLAADLTHVILPGCIGSASNEVQSCHLQERFRDSQDTEEELGYIWKSIHDWGCNKDAAICLSTHGGYAPLVAVLITFTRDVGRLLKPAMSLLWWKTLLYLNQP